MGCQGFKSFLSILSLRNEFQVGLLTSLIYPILLFCVTNSGAAFIFSTQRPLSAQLNINRLLTKCLLQENILGDLTYAISRFSRHKPSEVQCCHRHTTVNYLWTNVGLFPQRQIEFLRWVFIFHFQL